MTRHWLAGWEEERGQFQGDSEAHPLVCSVQGQPLRCRFGSPEAVDPLTADALLFHLPHISPVGYEFPPRFFRGQAFCGMSMVSGRCLMLCALLRRPLPLLLVPPPCP